MRVILLESVDNVGAVGDVVNVRPGFARNFLLPNKKATAANERNIKAAAHQKFVLEHKVKRARAAAEEIKKVIEGKGISIRRKAGESGKLFGSVTTGDVAEALRGQGIAVNRKFLKLDEAIKKTGKYKISVTLDGGLAATVNLEVTAEEA